jgi:hypothetical protein
VRIVNARNCESNSFVVAVIVRPLAATVNVPPPASEPSCRLASARMVFRFGRVVTDVNPGSPSTA